jgi:hypothetical protein
MSFVTRLGSPTEILALAKERAQKGGIRELWGLWLLAPVRCLSETSPVEDQAAHPTLQESWVWLCELLRGKDHGLADRYAPFAQWTERLIALALVTCEKPAQALFQTWNDLATQRLEKEDIMSRVDSWRPSQFLVRAGYFASHIAQVKGLAGAAELWEASHRMAITVWLDRAKTDSFAEVAYGLAHLARGRIDVSHEPLRTFQYLVGEIDEVADATSGLLSNDANPEDVMAAARAAGIDLEVYLDLARDVRRKDAVDAARAKLAKRRIGT